MKTILSSFIPASVLLLLFFSCQKEVHFDFISEGSLLEDNNNNCLVTVNGSFITGRPTDATNSIAVQVDISAKGNYSISSNTVNGYSFTATGSFKDTGSQKVILSASGKPAAAGIDHFEISYGQSRCEVAVTVLDASNAASFTLQGAPGNCMIDTITGNFVAGIALDTGNQAKVLVNVSVPGFYSVSTDTLDGYSFSAAGTFTSTGVQAISLSASGTPGTEGTDVFTLHAGAGVCTFSVPVVHVVATANPDHFPLTMSSYWDYNDLYYKGSIVTNIIIDTTAVRSGHTYRTMEEEISPGGPLILYYRKTGFEYFEYATIDKYTSSFQYSKRIFDDLLFLKENLSTHDQWLSPEYSDTASFGQLIGLQYEYTCLDANATVTFNGRAFTEVYKIQMKPKIKGAANIFNYTGEIYLFYYAKGVGLVYYKKTTNGFNYGEWQIKDWQVN